MKKIVSIIMMMTACLLILSGCTNISKYHAELFDNIGEYVNEEFLKENTLAEDVNDFFDATVVKKRLFTVKTEKEMQRIFNESFDPKIDFDSQILIVYTCFTNSPKERALDKINFSNSELEIVLKDKDEIDRWALSSCEPYQRWIAVKIDKVEFDSVEFEDED